MENNKKIKQFSAQEFRNNLKTNEAQKVLENFLQIVKSNAKHDCILEFLEKGGTCLEILHVMDTVPSIPPSLIFQVINDILLRIGAKYPQFHSVANEACRYLLNNYVTLINKMLSLSSTTIERVSALKVLTTIVTFSTVFAKDILLHINFNPTNIEMLTKTLEGKNEVREAFINFLVAYLVDGHFPPLSVLLEKKGLFTSIINGMKYDRADVVVLVMTAMKNHILENTSVSKTVKMKTFNTQVVREIVNLYNWKGPAGFQPEKKKIKTIVEVDEVAKTNVSEAVHAFLLVFCASHKYGVIFKDHSIGLNRKNVNGLIYTILESLDKPWEHRYASELVVKICGACPDQVRGQWSNLKSYLEPRLTVKWLDAMQFASNLVDELKPSCIEFALKELTVSQITQIMQILILPLPILKTIIAENNLYENHTIKYNILKLLAKMLQQIQNYLQKFQSYPNIDLSTIQTNISNYITRNFPDAQSILLNWNKIDENHENESIEPSTISNYLGTTLEIFKIYKNLAPHLLDTLTLEFDIREFFATIATIDDQESLKILQVQVVKFLLDLEPNLFNLKSDVFETVFKSIMEYYYETKNIDALQTLNGLLKNSNIFLGREIQINFWIDGILNLKNFNNEIVEFLLQFYRFCYDQSNQSKLIDFDLFNCLNEFLQQQNYNNKNFNNYLSFVILNTFHINPTKFEINFGINSKIVEYFQNWKSGEISVLGNIKNILNHFHLFSTEFFGDNFEKFIENSDFELYPDFRLNLLQMFMFYLESLIKINKIDEKYFRNFEIFIKKIPSEKFEDSRYFEVILNNSTIIDEITIFETNNLPTKFILNVVNILKNSHSIVEYFPKYRAKIVKLFLKSIKNPQNYSSEIFEIFELEFDDCVKIFSKISSCYGKNQFCSIFVYCLNRISQLKKNNKKIHFSDYSAEILKYFNSIVESETIGNLGNFANALHNFKKFYQNPEAANLLNSLLLIKEYHKDILTLCHDFLEATPDLFDIFEKNLDEICEKKGFILSLLNLVLVNRPDLIPKIYEKLEPSILKILEKPHKANQHFQTYYEPLGQLLQQCMEVPKNFGNSVQKFQTTELFHVYLLKIIFTKIDYNNQILSNIILTFIHLEMNLLKQFEKLEPQKLDNISQIFYDFLNNLDKSKFDDLSTIYKNETFSIFCKLCLKYGIGQHVVLLKILGKLIEYCFAEDGAKLILEMMFSHSKFLDIILNPKMNRLELLQLWYQICMKWPQFAERNHVPVLLAGYTGTQEAASKIILSLLQEYQSKAEQTQFYDFKPFLWGTAAASYYSVRSDIQKVLWRQPRMSDVLENLQEAIVNKTIENPDSEEAYDLDFFLPLFSHLLAPENAVQTYRFTKSGALSLTLLGLCRDNHKLRLAACHVLYRFHFHLEARQTGKDNLLWIQFVEAVCKGTALVEDQKLNNFVGIFLARMAMILTQPTHSMYLPLSNYLTAKSVPDFKTIPELYTFLHSSDVNYRECRNFILNVLKDGCKTEKDFTIFMKSMAFKLISELCSSSLCDEETRFLIMDIFRTCCKLPLGDKVLNGSCSFSAQLYSLSQLLS